jgi:DNA-binding NtrC family response regulator
MGAALMLLQSWVLADRAFRRTVTISTELGDRELVFAAKNNMAVSLSKRGEWRHVFQALSSVALRDEQEAHHAIRYQLHVGRATRSLGFARRAQHLITACLRGLDTRELPTECALAHEYLGDTLADRGSFAAARDHYLKALRIGLKIAPSGELVAEAYSRLGHVLLSLGDLAGAEKALAEGTRVVDASHDDYERVGLLRVQAGLALEAGDLPEADRIFHKAAMLALARGFRFEHALTLETQGFAHRSTGRPDTADRFIGEARAIYEELGMTRLALRLGRGARALSRPRPRRTPPPISIKARKWERLGIHTRSHRFLAVLEEIEAIANTRLSVLFIGESGVGKELIVHALHQGSGQTGRLVAVNCAAIPETMLESELFGSRRGAFTGAENRDGLVAEADGGTLFLDEIGDMPLSLQAKLLRFLEASSYRPVGGKHDLSVDVRFVSATNADLERKVQKGTFREDLYHRIAGDVITIPPLRRRPEDIEHLANHFLREARGDEEGAVPTLDESILKAFRAYGWPGNVRELKNAVERAASRLGSRKHITAAMLPPKILTETGYDLDRTRDIQRLTEAVIQHDGSVTAAAKSLGVSRQTLYRRAERLGVDLDALRGS